MLLTSITVPFRRRTCRPSTTRVDTDGSPSIRTRRPTEVITSNYGEAGAIDFYGPKHGLPPAISGINSYWYRGYGNPPPTTVIVLGDDAEGVRDTPATCTLAGKVRIPHGVENEESGHPDIYLCRDFRFEWAKAWPLMQSFG